MTYTLESQVPLPKSDRVSKFTRRKLFGDFGDAIAEVVVGGRPKSFLLEPPSRARLRVDIYVPQADSAFEVKAGWSKVREGQLAH